VTQLRRTHVDADMTRLWIGQAVKEITDTYTSYGMTKPTETKPCYRAVWASRVFQGKIDFSQLGRGHKILKLARRHFIGVPLARPPSPPKDLTNAQISLKFATNFPAIGFELLRAGF
jgi:hypothetical protein